MRCPNRWVETAWFPVVYHPSILSLWHRELVSKDFDLSHPNISPLPELGQLDAFLSCHFLVYLNYLWLEKPRSWYHLTLIMSIPDATPKIPWPPPEKLSRSYRPFPPWTFYCPLQTINTSLPVLFIQYIPSVLQVWLSCSFNTYILSRHLPYPLTWTHLLPCTQTPPDYLGEFSCQLQCPPS